MVCTHTGPRKGRHAQPRLARARGGAAHAVFGRRRPVILSGSSENDSRSLRGAPSMAPRACRSEAGTPRHGGSGRCAAPQATPPPARRDPGRCAATLVRQSDRTRSALPRLRTPPRFQRRPTPVVSTCSPNSSTSSRVTSNRSFPEPREERSPLPSTWPARLERQRRTPHGTRKQVRNRDPCRGRGLFALTDGVVPVLPADHGAVRLGRSEAARLPRGGGTRPSRRWPPRGPQSRTPPPVGAAFALSRLSESNRRPIHYE